MATQQQWLQEAAAKLSQQRQAAGKKLKSAVESSLAQLAMEGCEFEVAIIWSRSQEVGSNSDTPHPMGPLPPFSGLQGSCVAESCPVMYHFGLQD